MDGIDDLIRPLLSSFSFHPTITIHPAKEETKDGNDSGVEEWRTDVVEPLLLQRHGSSIDVAVRMGFAVEDVGFAFAGGYQAAVRALLQHSYPRPPHDAARLYCLCASEKGGNAPQYIQSTLQRRNEGWYLNGRKSFVTLGNHADRLIVLAHVPEQQQQQRRKDLRCALVEAKAPGVALHRLPHRLHFIPSIPHSSVELRDVTVVESDHDGEGHSVLLKGDGWKDIVRPFRRIEDLHVLAAVMGCCLRIAKRLSWKRELMEHIVAIIATCRQLCAVSEWKSTHSIILEQVLVQGRLLLREVANDEHCWEIGENDNDNASVRALQSAFVRDIAVMNVARKATPKETRACMESVAKRENVRIH